MTVSDTGEAWHGFYYALVCGLTLIRRERCQKHLRF